tara:strand:+ start:502 stop:858 length:357 start_codon:yes stop_codon:yes gene_type:complete
MVWLKCNLNCIVGLPIIKGDFKMSQEEELLFSKMRCKKRGCMREKLSGWRWYTVFVDAFYDRTFFYTIGTSFSNSSAKRGRTDALLSDDDRAALAWRYAGPIVNMTASGKDNVTCSRL